MRTVLTRCRRDLRVLRALRGWSVCGAWKRLPSCGGSRWPGGLVGLNGTTKSTKLTKGKKADDHSCFYLGCLVRTVLTRCRRDLRVLRALRGWSVCGAWKRLPSCGGSRWPGGLVGLNGTTKSTKLTKGKKADDHSCFYLGCLVRTVLTRCRRDLRVLRALRGWSVCGAWKRLPSCGGSRWPGGLVGLNGTTKSTKLTKGKKADDHSCFYLGCLVRTVLTRCRRDLRVLRALRGWSVCGAWKRLPSCGGSRWPGGLVGLNGTTKSTKLTKGKKADDHSCFYLGCLVRTVLTRCRRDLRVLRALRG